MKKKQIGNESYQLESQMENKLHSPIHASISTQYMQNIQATEDDLNEREKNAETSELFSAKTTRTVSQPVTEDVSVDSFVKQQEDKKAALDRLLEEQKARLATLNSPLPSTPDQVLGVSPTITPSPFSSPSPSITPQVPDVSPSITPTPAVVPSPPSRGPMPGLSLSELTMKSQTRKSASSPASTTPTPSSPPPPASDPAPRLNLMEMTMLNKSKDQKVVKKPPTSSTTSRSTPKERKGPIRQFVPIQDDDNDDDEDDDFFEYSRNGNNSNMSIKDIMSRSGASADEEDSKKAAKQKSKMWGIDIDKFDL